ncbi:uncharacterized protein BYT42DRAFT_490600 [Radiomyces spectabilis]|uniref:uncharacterized protein n=1 Tax=Radiomyces spectabilis TaxID=64574 RepID=UPI00221F633F|nr:uncharacterized protein BYT42DRAFT_490600 [Radiomyces spectabilis]KAI8391253.1 hypothetical protein BYT42DRAFT_490600 [Radiomyces spectabilis]
MQVQQELDRSTCRGLLLLARRNDLEFTKGLVNTMETRFGLVPQQFEYHALMYAYGVHNRADDAYALLNEMRQRKLTPNVYTYNTLIGCFKRQNNLNRIIELFEQMEELNIKHDVVTYNSMIDIMSRINQKSKAYEMYDMMLRKGIQPDMYTYSILLNIAIKDGNVAFGRKICQNITEAADRSKSDVNLVNSMLSFYAESEEGLGEILDMYYSLPSAFPHVRCDVVTYNTLLNACLKRENPSKALTIFRDMKKAGIQPDVVTYGILIDAEAKSGGLANALNLFDKMRDDGFPPNERILNSLANIASSPKTSLGAIMKLMDYVSTVADQGIQLDRKAYNAIMSGLARNGCSMQAQQLYDDVFRHHRHKADIATFTNLILAYINDQQTDVAMDIYYELRNHYENLHTSSGSAPVIEIDLDVPFYTSLITALTHQAERIPDSSPELLFALSLFNDMRQLHIQPNAHAYTAILHACGRHKDSYVLEEIHQLIKMDLYFDPDTAVYNALMDAYNRTGDGDTVLQIWETLALSSAPEAMIDQVSVSIVLDSCGHNGYHFKAQSIWKMLKDEFFPLNSNNYNSYIECLCRKSGRDGWDEARRLANEEMLHPHGKAPSLKRVDPRMPMLEEKTVNTLISFARKKKFSQTEIDDLEKWKAQLFPSS